MSKLEVEFKFEIGDIVFVRCAQHTIGTGPAPFMIVERVAQECPGGVQLQYMIQGPKGPEGPYMEIALSKEEPAYRAMTEAALDEQNIVVQRQAAYRADKDLIFGKTGQKES